MGEKESMTFESAMTKLEEKVNKLESGGLTLEQTLIDFTEGIELINFCNKELNQAEKKIEQVLKEKGEFTDVVPFALEEG